jgi:hypothetical protein
MPLQDTHLSVLWPLFPVLIAIGLWFGVKAGGDNLLKNRSAPSGIGSLERAGSVHETQKVIATWNHMVPERRTPREIVQANFLAKIISNDGRMLTDVAKRSLVFDLFFILFYATTLAVACLLAATEIAVRRRNGASRLVSVGIRLAYLQLLTASLDVIEDFALWRMLKNSMLTNSIPAFWPELAYACSIAKYGLIAITLIYVFIAFVFWIIDHKQPQSSKPRATVTA